tara:strand:- start:5710 stop:6618 length:909 start_codon:yes stop_codon:yes gene_type:complete
MNIQYNKKMLSCDLKCKLHASYGTSTATITNGIISKLSNYDETIQGISLGNYISKDTKVKYNNISVDSTIQVAVFTPSIHKFNGHHTAGELVVLHKGNGKYVAICIPIITNTSNNSLSTILSIHNLNTIPAKGESTAISIEYNLNDYIKHYVPYFTYTGSLFFINSNSDCEFIVFDKEHAISLDNDIIKTIHKIINNKTSYSIPNINNIRLYYNSKGISSSSSDNIYISCNPVGESGSEEYDPVKDHKDKNIPNLKNLIPFNIDVSTEALIIGMISGIAVLTIIGNIYHGRRMFSIKHIDGV